jgi:hypothetical protein
MEWNHARTAATPSMSNVPKPAELPATDHIILDVGGRKFRSRKTTLQDVPYFQRLFSGRWTIELLPDGSLPIDADPDVFTTLMEYIRRPSVYPLLWTREKGFDYMAYNKLMAEADYFGLDELKQWIQQRQFMKAVKTTLKMQIHPARFDMINDAGNHTYLHTKKPRPLPYQDAEGDDQAHPTELAEKRTKHNLLAETLESNRMQTEDLELVQCFEIKVPSKGRYECPDHINDHDHPDICIIHGCQPGEHEMDLYYPESTYEYESLPSSIVTVVKCHEYRPEACQRDYVDSDEAEV